jgi:hypothetical protein
VVKLRCERLCRCFPAKGEAFQSLADLYSSQLNGVYSDDPQCVNVLPKTMIGDSDFIGATRFFGVLMGGKVAQKPMLLACFRSARWVLTRLPYGLLALDISV